MAENVSGSYPQVVDLDKVVGNFWEAARMFPAGEVLARLNTIGRPCHSIIRDLTTDLALKALAFDFDIILHCACTYLNYTDIFIVRAEII